MWKDEGLVLFKKKKKTATLDNGAFNWAQFQFHENICITNIWYGVPFTLNSLAPGICDCKLDNVIL